MAPPPNPNAPLQQRLVQLATTLQFVWFVGHVTLLLCAFRFALSYVTFNALSKWSRFSYRTAFVAATATYGIVVFKSFLARSRSGKPQLSVMSLAGDENIQYLAMALIWLFSYQVSLAIVPFTVYSIFHVATYTRTQLLPAISPASATADGANPANGSTKPRTNSPLADSIGHFVKDYYDPSMRLVAKLEILLWPRVFLPALLFYKGTFFLLVTYSAFLRARHAQSSFVQTTFAQLQARIDAGVNRQDMPPAVRHGWDAIKRIVGQVVQATDVSRYAGGSQGPVKKAQ